MGALWEAKQEYKIFDPKIHNYVDTCGLGYERFIPYKRKYSELSQKQLKSLIRDAKRYHWQALDLSYCGLDSLPDELWELTELRMLYLGNNPAYRFIKFDRNMIEEMRNKLSILPRKIELLSNLHVLSLQNMPITVEGLSTLRLPQLVHLDIYYCGFPQVPDALLIPSLEEIDFNCLEEKLSESFMTLKNLRSINFSVSKFTELPESISALSKLEVLNLYRSEITSLPGSLLQLRNLRRIYIDCTPLEYTLPPEIREQSAKEIVNYVLAQQSDAPKQYFNESKMVIVGQGHVGKSSILNRLIHNEYNDEDSTEGIDIAPWHFSIEGQDYRLNVWDFGGQEIYHSTHQFFLTKRSLYLLVWDALAEEEYGRIDYWLKTIQSFADDSPILIVVNKCDHGIGRFRRIDEADYKERFPQIQKVYFVSCKDDIGISELREDIQNLALQLPLMKTLWLSTWMNVRKQLESLSEIENYIPYSEYLTICKAEGIENDEALSLIKYLHDLGIVLYYHDDPLLKNMVILSSEWGTDAVYKVLDEQEHKLKGRNGILYTDDLPEIWTDTDKYPHERYPYLLKLMQKFQLAFEITSTSYLVAELLDNKAITLDRSFAYGETLSFRYEYDFLPAGVMTRFIVAINRYLETVDGVKQCWKKGAYLKHRTAYALVRLYDNLADRHVDIKVSGKNPRDKQELLTVIRTTLEEINSHFNQIKITERIPCICSADCDFLFDYKVLLKAEYMGKKTIECHKSLLDVDIKKILDGVESRMENEFEKYGITFINSPQFSPQISPQITTTATASSTNTVTISVEVRNLINGMHGDMNDLKDEVGDQSEEFNEQCEKVEKALEKLDQSNSQEDVVRSGAMSKIERFLLECADPESKTGKLLAGIKYSADIVKNLAGKYNKIAKWVALPQLPFGDS